MLELIKEIKSRNIKTKAWVAEDPENRWAGLYPEDEAHWVERGITTLDALERSELEEYIYDAHKTAFGVKGRHYDFAAMSLQELKDEADYISKACDEAMKLEKEMADKAIEDFNKVVQDTIELGAGDEETALRWLTQDEKFYHIQCLESWVWDKGILFTNYGRDLVKKLEKIVTFQEWEEAA